MSKSVIDEALADAKQLKELAEENARRQLIEMVAPRIKELVESQLLGESASSAQVSELDEEDTADPGTSAKDESQALGESKGEDFELNKESLKAIAPLLRANAGKSARLEVSVATLGEAVQRACRIPAEKRGTSEIASQISELFSKIMNTYSHVHEAKVLDEKSRARLEEKLESYNTELTKEFKEIAMKKTNLSEADEAPAADPGAPPAPDAAPAEAGEDVVITLKGLKNVDADALNVDVQVADPDEESEEGGEEEAPAPEAGAEGDVFGAEQMESAELDGDTILEISDAELKREIARMRRMNEADSDVGMRMPKGGKIPVDDFGGGSDDGDPWLDHDVTVAPSAVLVKGGKKQKLKEADADDLDEVEEDDLDESEEEDMDEGQEDLDEADDDDDEEDMDEGKKPAAKKPVNEVAKRRAMLERQVKAEKARQLEAQKKISAYKNEAKKCPGTVREAQLKKRAVAEFKRIKESQAKVQKLQGALKKEGAANASSTTQSRLVRENNELKTKVSQVNLMNQKLLYANKLFMTEGVQFTTAMRNKILDVLDSAESLREAKTLYTKLSEQLKSRKGKIAESTAPKGKVISGSGSRVGQSAGAQLNESADAGGVELGRWQTLAGLSDKK